MFLNKKTRLFLDRSVELMTGVDPVTSSLPRMCATYCATAANIIVWWAIWDSNPGPTGYEPVALTN